MRRVFLALFLGTICLSLPALSLAQAPSTVAAIPEKADAPVNPVAWVWMPVILKNVYQQLPPTPTPTHTATSQAPTPTATTVSAASGVFAVSGEPESLSLNPQNGRLYVARSEAKDLAVLDSRSLALITTIPLGKGPEAVRVNPTLGRAYASYGNPLYVVSCPSNTVSGQIAEGVYRPSELAVNPGDHRIYVADWSTIIGVMDKVRVYNGNSNSPVGAVDLGTTGIIEDISVAVNSSTGKAYAAWSGDETVAIIGPNAQLLGRITPSSMSSTYEPWLAVNPLTNRLYLRGRTTTQVIDLNSNTEVGTLSEDGLIAVDTLRNLVYVHTSSRIHVYDGATNAKLRQINLDKYRYVTDIACDETTRRIFLAAPSDDEIVVVQD